MSKLNLNNVPSLVTAPGVINTNNQRIEDEFDKVLYRDGTQPNAMLSNIDMNGYRVTNLPDPKSPVDAIRLKDLDTKVFEAGLVSVATQSEAEIGANDTKLMTPQRTSQAIQAQNFDRFNNLAALLADTSLNYGPGASQVQAGDIVRTREEGFSYEVAPSAATDHDEVTAGGVKLYERRGFLATEEDAKEGTSTIRVATPLRVLQTVREGGFIPRNLFGLRDTLSDQTTAMQNAVNAIAEETTLRGTKRGACLNIEGLTSRIEGDLTIPRHVRVGGMRPVPAVYYGELIEDWQPAIELASTATIRVQTGAGLHNMMIRRLGLNATSGSGVTEVGNFAGTAITLPNNTGDQRLQGLAILGFNRAVDTGAPGSGETALISRPILWDIYIDCIHGVRIKDAYDIPKLFSIHGNPWVTEQLSGAADDKHFRNGTFIELSGLVNDWAHVWDCFSYGWLNGFVIDGADDVRLYACGADHLPGRVDDGSRGLIVQGNVFDFIASGFVSAAKQDSIYLNSTDATARYMILGFATHAFDQNAIILERGKLVLSQATIRGQGSGAGRGIYVLPTAQRLLVSDSVTFEEVAIGVDNEDGTVPVTISDRAAFLNVGQRNRNPYSPLVASGSEITIPGDHDFIRVSGTTGVGTMLSANIQPGRTVKLQAVSGFTVFNTGTATANTFRLGSDIVLSAGDLLEVTRDLNGQWRKNV